MLQYKAESIVRLFYSLPYLLVHVFLSIVSLFNYICKYVKLKHYITVFSDPTGQLGLASATAESHWASGYNSSYAAASYAAASSFAYGSGAAAGSAGSADLAGQQAAISDQSAASSQIPTGKTPFQSNIII